MFFMEVFVLCVNILSRRHSPFDIILKDTSNYYLSLVVKQNFYMYLGLFYI